MVRKRPAWWLSKPLREGQCQRRGMDPRSGVKANVSRQSLTDNQNHGHSLSHVMRYTEIRNAIKKKRKASVKKARRETEQNFCFSGGVNG